jgi:hypothetical protein
VRHEIGYASSMVYPVVANGRSPRGPRGFSDQNMWTSDPTTSVQLSGTGISRRKTAGIDLANYVLHYIDIISADGHLLSGCRNFWP